MVIKKISTRIKAVRDTRDLTGDLFTLPYIIENGLKINYHKYFKKGTAPEPIHFDLKVTRSCNASCSFCYADPVFKKTNELGTKEWKKFINKFSKKKIFFITGGEPFIRKDVLDIIRCIKEQGSFCGIVTNGYILNTKTIENLVRSKLDLFLFSLHGNPEINSKIMNLKGNSNIENLKKLVQRRGKRNKPLIGINSVITSGTLNGYKEIIEISDKIGIDFIRFAHPNFLLPKEKNVHMRESISRFGKNIQSEQYVNNNVLESKQIIDMIKRIKRIKSNVKILFFPDLSLKEIENWYSRSFKTNRECLYLYSSAFINELGDVYPCVFYSYKLGNITKQEISEIWNSKNYKNFRTEIKNSLLPGCNRCCKPC